MLSRSLLIAFSGTAVMTGGQAVAQQAAPADTSLQRVEVTGSRIRSIDLETAQPVLTLTRQDIVKSGLVTAGDIVNSLTTSGSPAFSKGSTLVSNREQGGQFADMRNLGAQRVLVLVNGKRWATTINGYTDLSNIPTALIERVEVLKDGASAVYGSDAIAGVVNFIMKDRFEGAEAAVYYGSNEKGDGRTQQYDLTWGARGEKSSLMANISVSKQGTVWAHDRDITSTSFGPLPDRYNANFGVGPWGRYRLLNSAGAATGSTFVLNHTGSYLGDGVGQDSRNTANYHTPARNPDDTFNSTSQMMFTSPSDLKSIFLKGDYDIASNLRFKATAMYGERVSTRQVAGYPLNSLSQAAFPVFIDKDSYYNPLGSSVVGAGLGRDLYFQRRTIEVPRVTENNYKSLHVDAGVEGDFKLGTHDWNWDAGFNYNRGTGTVTGTGNLNLLALKKALGPSFLTASGTVQCGTAAAPIAPSACTPFNILGGPSASTPEALAYVMATTQGTYGSTISSLAANVTGGLYTLPAGELSLAAGGEYRKVKGYDRPDSLSSQGYTTDLAAGSTNGNYDIKEVYGELSVPILKGVPGADLLNINLASRYSDYSNFGNTTNNKVSFIWKPVKDLLTRGTYAEGFRAPTLGDVFGGGSQTFDSYADPCDSVNGAAARDAAVAARCAAGGTPVGFRQVNQAGNVVGAGGAQGISAFNSGAGNAFLKPETAKTKTLGFVYSPSQIAGLSTSVDWYKIEVKSAITAVGTPYVLNQCYVLGNPEFCASIRRDPVTGMIINLSRGNANLGGVRTEGYDFNVTYVFPKSATWGNFKATLDATYLTKYEDKATDTADWQSYNGEWPYYRVKANLALDWNRGPFAVRLMTRFYGATKDQCWNVDPAVDCNAPTETASWGEGVNHKHALVFNDLNVAWTAPWKGTISIGVNNLFDIKPRLNYQTNSAFNGNGTSSSSSVDPDLPIDRFFYLRYSQTF